MTAVAAPDLEGYERDHRGLAEGPAWSRALRERGMGLFLAAGFPADGEEAWRFTSLKPLRKLAPVFRPGNPDELAGADLVPPPPRDWTRLVFVNGAFAPALSTPNAPAGVEAGSLGTFADGEGNRAPLLGKLLEMERHRFAALNAAFLTDGASVRIAAGVRLTEPIHLLFLTVPGGAPRAVYPRAVIEVGEGARGVLIEEHRGVGDQGYFTAPAVEVSLGAAASLDHVRLEREGTAGIHLGAAAVAVGRDARYASHALSLGGRLTRLDLDLFLDGEGGEGILNGLYLPTGRRHVDHHTRVEHQSPHTASREHYKGVLTGKATAVFNGRIVIHPGAQQVDASQTNNNLLLSPDALVNTNPELEIFADDVKARHGATIGQLEDEPLFYLRSRGIDLESARRLLVYAFAGEILDRIPVPSLREELAAAVEGII